MRLLHSYCNRDGLTKRLAALLRRAGRENGSRTPAPLPRKSPRRLSTAAIGRLMADYQSGLTVPEVSARHGVTAWTVRHRLHRAGVTLRPVSMTEDQIGRAVELRGMGMSYDRIAEQVGFSSTTIRTVLHRCQL